MTVANWISILAIAVGAAVAIAVGSAQRKQMRQIELYKQDPSVGLVPPPSALTRFVTSKLDQFLGYGGPLLGLGLSMFTSGPVTRLDVFVISLSIAFLLANIVMQVVFRLAERTAHIVQRLLDAQERHLELTGGTVSALKDLAEGLGDSSNGA